MSDPVEVTPQRSLPERQYSASRITLYGVPLTYLEFPVVRPALAAARQQIHVASYLQIVVPPIGPILVPDFQKQVALIYGYAYQGHCYSFPEPVVLLVNIDTQQPALGCGYDPALGYQMWSAEKLDTTVQIQVTQDFFEELVLRRNLGTAKQPVSYHSAAMVSHRGGKLME
jgi:hypothetical protein